MGVIDIYSASSPCLIKPMTSLRPLQSCTFEGTKKRVVAMASTVPVEQQVNEGQERLTGDSFIRTHLRKLSPYQPILPFEVL